MKQYYIAAAYGAGDYNTSTYNGTAQSSAAPTTPTTQAPGVTETAGSNAGVLANTGFEVLLAVTLACFIIFVSLLVRFWRRKPVAVPVEIDDTPDNRPLL